MNASRVCGNTGTARTRDEPAGKGELMLNVGEKAPEFRLKNADGKEVALGDYRGKSVVLCFIVKANTSG